MLQVGKVFGQGHLMMLVKFGWKHLGLKKVWKWFTIFVMTEKWKTIIYAAENLLIDFSQYWLLAPLKKW